MFPAGLPTEMCVPVQIINDQVSLEGDETFIFELDALPEGVLPGPQPNSTVVIEDDDCKAELKEKKWYQY